MVDRRWIVVAALVPWACGRSTLEVSDDVGGAPGGAKPGPQATGGCPQSGPTGVVATLQGIFEPVGTMQALRQQGFTATLLADGRVLVVGGESYSVGAFYGRAEIYDPTRRTFTFTGSLREARSSHRATRLCDGGSW